MSPADDDNENPWDVKGDNANSGKKFNKNDDQNPFVRGRSGNQPPEFSKVINEFGKRFKESHGNGGGGFRGGGSPQSPGKMFGGIFALLILVWAGSGLYRVQEGEVAVILRFGKLVRTASPGLCYRLPAPIEREIIKKVAVVNQIDSNHNQESDSEQSLILTGDENMVLTNYTIMWKIKDITQYLFVVRKPDETIRAAAESALREIIGQTTAVKALTDDRDLIGNQVQELLQKILDTYNAGVQITSFRLQKVAPPAQVVEAYNDMQASRVDADRLSNEAQSYSNDILPKARGQAESILRAAEAYAAEVVARAEGESSRFTQVLKSNKKNPTITRIRMHREVMDQLMKQANLTIVDHDLSKSLQNYNQLTPVPLLNKKEGA